MRAHIGLALAACALAVLAGTAAAAPAAAARMLILTTPGYELIDFMEKALTEKGIEYDVIRWDGGASPRPNLTSILYTEAGAPKYSGIIMIPNIEALGDMNKVEVKALWRYQRRTGARSVKFNAWPSTVGFEPDESFCTAAPAPMKFSSGSDEKLAGLGAKLSSPLNATGLYRCPGVKAISQCNVFAADFEENGIISKCTTTPILTVELVPGTAKRSSSPLGSILSKLHFFKGGNAKCSQQSSTARRLLLSDEPVAAAPAAAAPAAAAPAATAPKEGVAGVLVEYADGRESLAFFFDCAMWSPSCMSLAGMGAAWLSEERPAPAVDEAQLQAEAEADEAEAKAKEERDASLPGQIQNAVNSVRKGVESMVKSATEAVQADSC